MAELQVKPVNESDFQELKSRMKLIAEADPSQYHNEFSLKRYLRAFKTADAAFKVSTWLLYLLKPGMLNVLCSRRY